MNNLNLKNKKVIILTYQTYHYDFYKNISNQLDELIKDNFDLDNNKFDLIEKFLKEKNISYFVAWLEDSKDPWFLKDLYESSYYQKILTFDNNQLIDNKIFFDLMKKMRDQIDNEIESLEVDTNDRA